MITPYQKYAGSDIKWVEAIPEDWKSAPLYTVASESKLSNKGMIEDNLLSLSFGRIKRKSIDTQGGLLPASFETYQIVNENDIIFRLTDLQNDKRSLRSAQCTERGIITSAYVAVTPNAIRPRYLHYLMRAYDETKVFYNLGAGMRQSLKYDELKRLPILLPPELTQQAIEKFLDRETQRIDSLIEEKQTFIKLLKEKRQALISHVVTKGLNPNVEMQDSGIEWIGQVPKHWVCPSYRYVCEIYRGKFTHRPRNDPAMFDGIHPFIQTGDVARAKNIISSYSQTLSDAGTEVSQLIPKGTLMMVITGAKIGSTAILGFDSYAPDSVVGFKAKPTIELSYLKYSLMAALPALEQTSIQSTQPNLNIDRIGSLKTPLPPLDEQVSIVNYIENQLSNFETVLSAVEDSIKLLLERRTSLISAAVTGKIDVREAV
ncbi:restriction endonuclease subunit S [Vibrio parahaemolyticus]